MIGVRSWTLALCSLMLLGCKPKGTVAKPEEARPVKISVLSHCPDLIAFEVVGGGEPRTVRIPQGKPLEITLAPGQEIRMQPEGADPMNSGPLRKAGATLTFGSDCLSMVASDLGGHEDPSVPSSGL
jgi:hypothetical protein